jgi:hypothetical protein
VVLNQTRLKALIAAFGTNPDNLIGKTVIISRVPTMFKGEPTWGVGIEPIVADRIATRGATVTAIGGHRESPKPSVAPPIDRDLDSDIPF